MNTDIRIQIDFLDHHKTGKLKRRYGAEGIECLLRLWLYTAKHRPEGVLAGMDAEDVAIAAHHDGDAVSFVNSLCDIGWLDTNPDGDYVVHDWHDHNSWASKADERSNTGRFSRMAKTHPDLYSELKGKGYTGISKDEYEALTIGQRNVKPALTPAPAPAPAPAPSPAPIANKTFSSDSDEIRLSKLLFDLIRENNPDHKKPNFQSWARHIDLAIRRDERAPADLEQAIRWCQSDEFWFKNILSTEKLRKQFDTLKIHMKGNNGNGKHFSRTNGATSTRRSGGDGKAQQYDSIGKVAASSG